MKVVLLIKMLFNLNKNFAFGINAGSTRRRYYFRQRNLLCDINFNQLYRLKKLLKYYVK